MKTPFSLLMLSVFPTILVGITTLHHDKPEDTRMSQMATKMKRDSNRNIPNFERQKRLLPYINYYLNHNHQRVINQQRNPKQEPPKTNEKFTPFQDSNAIPGPFIPILKTTPKTVEVGYNSPPQIEKVPDYSVIYDTLAQLKQRQQLTRPPLQRHNTNPVYRKPQINYVPVHYYENQQYNNVQPVKTVIETYTPTNIDIPNNENVSPRVVYKIHPQTNQYIQEEPQYNHYEQVTTKPRTINKPVIFYQPKQEDNTQHIHADKQYTQNENPVIYTLQTTPKPQVNTIVEEQFVAQKFTTPNNVHYENVIQYTPVQFITEKYEPKRYELQYPTSTEVHQPVTTENTNILGRILKQLQNSNTLPRTFTPDNIDNSIKTLAKILNSLRKQQRISIKPIVVLDENSDEEEEHDEDVTERHHYVPGTITQTFPANTVEGGTPGRPGIDYPALSSIPQTSFNCKTQRYKGFFGDPHTNCQVWHYCDLNGGQASFLCPNGTIFSQVALTCDWWYNVKCASTTQLYVLNERLYKYILPLSPKFPEDYSGPLVDRYLALKFKEMEEKMKKEKKDDDGSEEQKDDSDQLQDIQNEKAKFSEEK